MLLSLYQERQPEDPLHYLGLPGTDLLDLRYLHEQLCHAAGRTLRFLGFVSEAHPKNPASADLHISLEEVRRLANVDPHSDVIADDFRSIGNQRSMAWTQTKALGPFDIVNLDLCDGLASDPPKRDDSIYDALAQLIAIQARNLNPWLLLVTTRIGHGKFDAQAEEAIFEHFSNNVEKCEGFAEACEECLNFDARSIDPATCSENALLDLMIVAIGKWLAVLMQSQGPSRVELVSTYGYRINPAADQEDLVSFALRFEPVIAAPPNPLSPTAPNPVDECATAMAILKRSTCRQNVDTILEQNQQTRERSINETKRLLKQARYEVADYCAWLAA